MNTTRETDAPLPAPVRRGARARPLTNFRDGLEFIWAVSSMSPVFAARTNELGGIDGRDPRWHGWQKYGRGLNGSYKPGDAVAAVCGVGFDVLEVDPRNGGLESWPVLLDLLGDEPDYFARLGSPSDGFHHYIATLGIGSHNNILPGIDLKGGLDNGTGRGFVFTPPTLRPRKTLDESGCVVYGPQRPYLWDGEMGTPGRRDWRLAGILRDLVDAQDPATHSRYAGNGGRRHRLELEVYREICLNAKSGGQRGALLLYVRELTLRGLNQREMLSALRELTGEMRCFDTRRPWTDRELRSLFYKRGSAKIIPDASNDEMEVL